MTSASLRLRTRSGRANPARGVLTARPPVGAAALLLVLALAAAAAGRAHGQLLYPDGYQYLLMAQGLAESGRSIADLGGWSLMPNADAAAKPLLPGLLALVELAGGDPRVGAAAVAAAGLAAAVALTGLLTMRLTGSPMASLAAAGALAASPAAGHWLGFGGPDALAVALALGAGAAAAWDRPVPAGVLFGLAGAARPELLLAGLVVALGVWVTRPASRRRLLAAVAAGALTLAAVLMLVRPPLVIPAGAALAPLVVLAGVLLWWGAERVRPAPRLAPVVAALVAGAGAAAMLALGAAGPLAGLGAVDRVLAVAAAAAAGAALMPSAVRAQAPRLLAAALPLASLYAARNPGSERYLSLLAPLAAVLIGLGVAAVPGVAPSAVAALSLVVVGLAAVGARPAPAEDVFTRNAAVLAGLPGGPVLTAAPDAYGSLLPDAAVRPLEVGRRGLIVLDAAQRLHHPELTAHGRPVARVPSGAGFTRPGGSIDGMPAVIVRGVVITAPNPPGTDSRR